MSLTAEEARAAITAARESGIPDLEAEIRASRHEVLRATMPTMFCCAAGAARHSDIIAWPSGDGPLFSPPEDGSPPRWFSPGDWSPLTSCPECGRGLPDMVRRTPPEPVQVRTGARVCGVCRDHLHRCLCLRPQAAWEAGDALPPTAAVVYADVIVPGPYGGTRLVLSVSRKGRPSEKGLPGGKIDPGESPEAAAVRELYEETGLRPEVGSWGPEVWPVFDAVDDSGVRAIAFRARVAPSPFRTPESGLVEWVTPSALVDSSPFSSYNSALLQRVRILPRT